MSRLAKAITVGLLTGIVGLVVGFTPVGLNLEENAGLELLFKLRGERRPPSEVIIVSIDRNSASRLNLPNDPDKGSEHEWNRKLG
jgi:adenylate cyclase